MYDIFKVFNYTIFISKIRIGGLISIFLLKQLISVFAFKSSIEKAAQLLSQRNLNVYLYSFEHHSTNSVFQRYTGGYEIPVSGGVAHGDGKTSQNNDFIFK